MKKAFLIISSIGFISSIILTNIKFINQKVSIQQPYHQLYVVGDSLSDTGTLVKAASQFLDKPFSLDEPFYQNRSFSNGQVAVEILAEKLNLTLKSGWDFNFLWKEFKQIGNNYATGGAQASESTSQQGLFLNNFTINKQVDTLVKQHQIQTDDLIFFEIGSNDLIFQVLDQLSDKNQKFNDIVTMVIKNQEEALKKLINHGSKHILVMNSPDLGKTPNYKNTNKEKIASTLTKNYNTLWFNMISNLQSQYPSYIKVFDIYHIFPKLLNDFVASGGEVDQGAVSYSLDAKTFLSGRITPRFIYPANEETIDNYFFFDFIHPTKSVHASVGHMLYQAVKNW